MSLDWRYQRRCGADKTWYGADDLLGHHPGEQAVHAFVRVADCHRRQGVAVIAAAEGQEAGLALHAAIDVELQRHLHGDLDRHRTGLGQEDVVRLAGSWLSPPNITCGMVSSCLRTAAAICG